MAGSCGSGRGLRWQLSFVTDGEISRDASRFHGAHIPESERAGEVFLEASGRIQIAREIGCPAICRDEIKEGMVLATPGFVPGPADELSARTLPVFFGVAALLVRAGVTTVAEAAFQNRLWRPSPEPLRELAEIRIVHCTVDGDIAVARSLRRHAENPLRRAHADPRPQDSADLILQHRAFDRVSVDAPSIEVDTTDGFKPGLGEIVTFVDASPTAG
jgi:hypothetical protein